MADKIDYDELERLLAAATPGPWFVETDRSEGEYGSGPDTTVGYDAFQICAEGPGPYHEQLRVLFDSHNSTVSEIAEESWSDEHGGGVDAWDAIAKANAALIVAAVNELPNLIATAKAHAAEVEALREALEPFARELEKAEADPPLFGGPITCEDGVVIKIGDLQRARTALKESSNGQG